MTERKKIRGFIRKKRQLDSWANHIVNHNFEEIRRQKIFRVNFALNHYAADENISLKFRQIFFEKLSIILDSLKTNETIQSKEYSVKLLLYYPRTLRTLFVVGQSSDFDRISDQIELKNFEGRLPRTLDIFKKYKIMKGEDFVYPFDRNMNVMERKNVGNVWTIE